jgi:hypothetical protein
LGEATVRVAEFKHAIADSEPKFVVACVGSKAARFRAPAWLRRLLCVRNNVFDAGLVWRSRAANSAL